jgi:hypothetical protein
MVLPGVWARIERKLNVRCPAAPQPEISELARVRRSYKPGHFFGYFTVEADRTLDLHALANEVLSGRR